MFGRKEKTYVFVAGPGGDTQYYTTADKAEANRWLLLQMSRAQKTWGELTKQRDKWQAAFESDERQLAARCGDIDSLREENDELTQVNDELWGKIESVDCVVALHKKRIAELDAQVSRIIAQRDEWQEKYECLNSARMCGKPEPVAPPPNVVFTNTKEPLAHIPDGCEAATVMAAGPLRDVLAGLKALRDKLAAEEGGYANVAVDVVDYLIDLGVIKPGKQKK